MNLERRLTPKLPYEHQTLHPDSGREYNVYSLQYQLRRAEQQLTSGAESISPPSLTRDELFAEPASELRQRYPKRYQLYADAVRDARHRRTPDLQHQLETTHWLHLVNSLDRYVATHHAAPVEQRTLKAPQVTAFEKLQTYLEAGNMSGYFELPTGFGKTVLFATFLKALNTPADHYVRREMRTALRTRALIVVPTLQLVQQTIERLKRFAPELDIGSISSLRRPQEGLHATVITYDSLRSRVAKGTLQPTDYDVLIADEAHKGLSTARQDAMKPFQEHCLTLAFTATPEYDENKSVAKVFGERIHKVSIQEAVELGMLCGFRSYTYDTGIDLSAVQIKSTGEYDEKQLERLLSYRARAEEAVRIYREQFAGLQGYIFCENVTAAKVTAMVFNKEGISTVAVSAETPQTDREQAWEKFTDNNVPLDEKTRFLSNVDLYTQGTDYPEAAVAFLLNQTESPVRELQRGGRVLRTSDRVDNKVAHVVNFTYRDKRRNAVTFAQLAGEEAIALLPAKSMRTDTATNEPIPEPTTPTDLAAVMDTDLSQAQVLADLVDELVVGSGETGITKAPLEHSLSERQNELHSAMLEVLSNVDLMLTLVKDAANGHFGYNVLEKEAMAHAAHEANMAKVYKTDFDRMHQLEKELWQLQTQAYLKAEPVVFSSDTVTEAQLIIDQEVLDQLRQMNMTASELFDEATDIAEFHELDLIAA